MEVPNEAAADRLTIDFGQTAYPVARPPTGCNLLVVGPARHPI